MEQLADRVAVVTGAGGGIGAALVAACVDAGMRVVAVDVDAEGLARTAAATGATTAVVDVTNADAVEALAADVVAQHGTVHLVAANAGVFAGGLSWEVEEVDWRWTFDVNVLGVVHCIRAFVPRMLAAGEEGHVVCTSSTAGYLSAPLSGPYCASKFACVAVAECLHHDLAMVGAPIGVSVLMPGAVRTGIADSDRHRPVARTGAPDATRFVTDALADVTAAGVDPAAIAPLVLDAVRTGTFYVPTDPRYDDQVASANAARADRRAPSTASLV